MSRRSTSMRFSDEEIELIDAGIARRHAEDGTQLSRTAFVRYLLNKFHPKDGPGEALRRHREAYAKVFPS